MLKFCCLCFSVCIMTFFLCYKLLNEKNDDEDEGEKRNELLQHLMKDQDGERKPFFEERKLQEQQVQQRKINVTALYKCAFTHKSI